MERHGSFAERDPVAVAQSRCPIDAPIVQQEHVAGAGGQVDQHEFAIGRPLDERVVPVHRRMIERDVVVAVPPDAQHFAGEQDRRRRPVPDAAAGAISIHALSPIRAPSLDGAGRADNVCLAPPPHRAAELRRCRRAAAARRQSRDRSRGSETADRLRQSARRFATRGRPRAGAPAPSRAAAFPWARRRRVPGWRPEGSPSADATIDRTTTQAQAHASPPFRTTRHQPLARHRSIDRFAPENPARAWRQEHGFCGDLNETGCADPARPTPAGRAHRRSRAARAWTPCPSPSSAGPRRRSRHPAPARPQASLPRAQGSLPWSRRRPAPSRPPAAAAPSTSDAARRSPPHWRRPGSS